VPILFETHMQVPISRDAPIIGIGRLLCQYRLTVIYYVLSWHWILKLYFFKLQLTTQIFVL